MSNNLKNILVVGGSGFIGSHTADALTKNGQSVTILDKISSPWLKDSQKMIVGDILNQNLLEESMKDVECVYYFAGIADIGEAKLNPYKTFEINIMGLTKALEAAVKNNVKNTKKFIDICKKKNIKTFIFLSSSNVYKERKKNFICCLI